MQTIGIIGLAVMGRNLALNFERNGFGVSIFNRTTARTRTFLDGPGKGRNFTGAETIPEFVASLERPRRILLMVKAGAAVDAVIGELKPHLEPGDIIIDGGNSNFHDTERRFTELQREGLEFFGMGISGGEEGALKGPSLMPGGKKETYVHLEPILRKIAAKTDSGPCVTYVGARGAGHFVKMVHNGIEYGDMQLIAEAYDLMRNALELEPQEMAEAFTEWNREELNSFLIEITARIVDFPDDQGSGKLLVDMILDSAGQKGTGKWTTAAALDLGIPIPTITAAVDARLVSSSGTRQQIAETYESAPVREKIKKKEVLAQIRSALYASKICSYAQGFDLMREASKSYNYMIELGEIARIWKGGCIIRAVFLDRIREAFAQHPELTNLVLDDGFAAEIRKRVDDWRQTVMLGTRLGLATPAMSASLAYFDAFRRRRLPASLIQAQRDLFGAHTYERTDREGVFHTDWSRKEE